MTKNKKYVIICCIITALGLLLCITGTLMGGAITGIGISNRGLQVYKGINDSNIDSSTFYSEGMILDPFTSIDLSAAFASVIITESETDQFEIAYQLTSSTEPVIKVQNNCLTVLTNKYNSSSFQITFFGSFTSFHGIQPNNKITISVPKGTTLTDVKGDLPSGNVSLNALAIEQLKLNITFGTLSLSNITADTCTLSLDSGTIKLDNITTEVLSVKNTFGSVTASDVTVSSSSDFDMDSCDFTADHSDFGILTYQGTFGDINGTAIKAESLKAGLDSGNITLTDLNCTNIDMSNTFGKIKLSLIEPLENFNYDISTTFGSITVGDKKHTSEFTTPFQSDSNKKILLECDSSEITISQAK